MGATAEEVETHFIAYDEATERPYEECRVAKPELFSSFAERVCAALPTTLGEPLIRRFWGKVRARPDLPVGESFAAARRELEREWGCDNLELPVSRLANSETFLGFAFSICGDAARFADCHNAALAAYRNRNGLRSQAHPMPDLATDGEWQEVPFWAWSERVPRRGRVWARREGTARISLRFDNGLPDLTTPFPFVGAGPDHLPLIDGTYKLRPRALTLTLFARLCLADLFLHGIGGGKYDEVTDEIIRTYFGLEPPTYQVLSATLHLPLVGFSATRADVLRAERLVRDLHWNPQRRLDDQQLTDPLIQGLVAEKTNLIVTEPQQNNPARRRWFRALQEVTEQLRPAVAEQLPLAEERLRRMRAEVEANEVLRRRDYSFVLYPAETLRTFLQRLLNLPV
jgi:hypothetical protein